jgi:hypothetical protein
VVDEATDGRHVLGRAGLGLAGQGPPQPAQDWPPVGGQDHVAGVDAPVDDAEPVQVGHRDGHRGQDAGRGRDREAGGLQRVASHPGQFEPAGAGLEHLDHTGVAAPLEPGGLPGQGGHADGVGGRFHHHRTLGAGNHLDVDVVSHGGRVGEVMK